MKKYLVEGIGTLVLVLFLSLVFNNETGALIPMAYGAILIALIYAGAAHSGAQFNPALSLACLITRKLERWDAPYYWLAQLAAAGVAAVLAAFMIRCSGTFEIGIRAQEPLCALFAEGFGAFLLSFVYLNVMFPPAGESRAASAGLAIGFAVIAGVFAFGGISNATFNPAISFGLAINGQLSWADAGIDAFGACLGAAAGASVYKALSDTPEI